MRIPNLHHVHNEIQEGNKGKQFMNTGSDTLLTSKVREEVTPSLPDPYLLAYKNSTLTDKYHGAPTISVGYPDLNS